MKSFRGPKAILMLGASAVAFSALPVSVFAQSALEEIVVTARKREESLQSTPVSVSAFSGEALARAGVGDFLEIATRVPGFTMNSGNVTEPNIFMRGIGTDIQSAGASSAIGFFMDDVYLSRAQGVNLELFDFERVEVVRGPQGTLYGKNVVGGAVNYVTRKPTEDLRAGIDVTVGNYSTLEARGNVSGALAENLFGGISFSARSRDGFAKNTFTGNDMEDLSSMGVLGQLRWLASENVEVLLTADYTRRRGGGIWTDMKIPSNHNLPFKNPDPRSGPNNDDGKQDADVGGVHLRVNWDTGRGTLSSITAYRDADFDSAGNSAGSYIDFTSLPYFPSGQINIGAMSDAQIEATNDDYFYSAKTEKVKTFSQELRYTSNFEGPFNFMTGVFFMDEKIERNEYQDYFFVLYWNDGEETGYTEAKTKTYAAFVEGTYNVTDAFSITAGIRYTKDKKDFYAFRDHRFDFLGASFEDANGLPVDSFSASTDQSWSAWTPSVTLGWQATEDAYLYATVSKGFKSGGWNGENATSPQEAIAGYNPEYAWNYEIGTKTEWFDRRLRLNLTGFWAEYKDLQTQQYEIFDPNLPADIIISNAGKARVRGLELEVVAVPVEGLTISGSYSYMNGKITGDLISTRMVYDWMCDCSTPVDTNLKGNTLRRTPKHSFVVSGFYEAPVSDTLKAFVRGDYRWTDGYEFDNENNPRTSIGSYGILDAGIGIASADGKWEFSVWGKNLTDKLYESGKTDDIGTVLVSYAPPRTYGATVKWRY